MLKIVNFKKYKWLMYFQCKQAIGVPEWNWDKNFWNRLYSGRLFFIKKTKLVLDPSRTFRFRLE